MLHDDVSMVIDDAHFAKISLLNICRDVRQWMEQEMRQNSGQLSIIFSPAFLFHYAAESVMRNLFALLLLLSIMEFSLFLWAI